MLLFDANCTLGRWAAGGPTHESVDQVLGTLDRLGIERALVRHTMAIQHSVAVGNALLLEELRGQPRLTPCLAATTTVTGEMGPLQDWLDRAAASGVRSVAIYPRSHGYPLTLWQCGDLLAGLADDQLRLVLGDNIRRLLALP